MNKRNIFLITIFFFISLLFSNDAVASGNNTFVDKNGVIRWSDSKKEVYGFGVNYSTPFAHAYRMAEKMGVDHKQAIKDDIYHLSRLGFDLYRVHVWDVEISDTLGNLIQNEHLDLFDFTIAEMKNRGFNFVITPIAYWGNGWPEPDLETSGFATKYGKEGCLVHPDAIIAQENYLSQFMNHVNPYTGVAYKDETNLLVVEVCNEPHHKGNVDEVTDFINKMVNSIRSTGATVPVFYNMSHSIHLFDAYLDSKADGGTFQWYPAGLVAERALKGNFLPHVSSYDIPFASDERFKNTGKIIYEFDAADVSGNYMYPYMAQTFRANGFQLATQFDYDAMFLAPHNTNYGTHFMNLAYAPQKAISLKVAASVFHNQKLYEKTDKYLNVSAINDLVEYISPNSFIYSNNTDSKPLNFKSLQEIAGWGSSSVVKYDGTGAYFLDKIDKSVWRLEVMPDAYWVDDPYSPVSPKKQVAAVNHSVHKIQINIPELGSNFKVEGINGGNNFNEQSNDGALNIKPGVYILYGERIKSKVDVNTKFKNITLNEFVAPKSDLKNNLVKVNTYDEFSVSSKPFVEFEYMSLTQPTKIDVQFSHSNGGFSIVEATNIHQNNFIADLPQNLIKEGIVNYNIIVTNNDEVVTYPSGIAGKPYAWDMFDKSTYSFKVFLENSLITVFNPYRDWENTMKSWHPGVKIVPSHLPFENSIEMDFSVTAKYFEEVADVYAFKFYFKDIIGGRIVDFINKESIAIELENVGNENANIAISFQDKYGNVVTKTVDYKRDTRVVKLKLSEFKKGEYAIIPRAFPDFIPYFLTYSSINAFDWNNIDTFQMIVKPNNKENLAGVKLKLGNIWVE